MKFKFTYTFFSLALLAFVFSSSSGGRASAANEGNSGAPGDDSKTCLTCHANNAAIQVTLSIDVLDATGASIVSDGYTPGTVYDVVTTIEVASGNPEGYGFQMTALNAPQDQNGPTADNWSSPAANVQIGTVASSGRKYAEHNGVSADNVFRVQWTAPEADSGVVTFYSCGNGVNGNGETAGDNAACNVLVLDENTMTNTTQVIEQLEIAIAPNPVQSVLQLKTYSPNAGEYDLFITDILGRQVYSESFFMPQGEANSPIPVNHLQSGIYILQLHGNGQQLARQLIIQ